MNVEVTVGGQKYNTSLLRPPLGCTYEKSSLPPKKWFG